jgi:hypothetical protein
MNNCKNEDDDELCELYDISIQKPTLEISFCPTLEELFKKYNYDI